MIGSRLDIIRWLQNQKHDMYEIKMYSPKRSKSANAYYWEIVGQIAEAIHTSNAFVHNTLLRECAPPIEICGEVNYVFLPDTETAENDSLESMTYHLRPTSAIRKGKNGKTNYRAYILLKGSSEFNSKEMAVLIDRAIASCKDLDITPPPTAAIAQALKKMEKREEKHE